jgi:hypothetical protein
MNEHKIRGLRASHWMVGGPHAEPTEEELAAIRKAEGEPDPMAAIRVGTTSYTRDQWNAKREAEARLNAADIINRAHTFMLNTPLPEMSWRPLFPLTDEQKAYRKAKNKRRAANRFRARELRRQAGASALAPTVLPALAAGLAPVSPGPEADLLGPPLCHSCGLPLDSSKDGIAFCVSCLWPPQAPPTATADIRRMSKITPSPEAHDIFALLKRAPKEQDILAAIRESARKS